MATTDTNDLDRGGAEFGALARRAVELLEDAPDGLDGAALATLLFGAVRGPWAFLLDNVLAADDRIERDGARWRVRRTAPAAGAVITPSVVALALGVTGSDPRRHRLVRIVAVRRGHRQTIGRLDLLVNPRRRLPRYLAIAARLTPDEVAEAPGFAEVVPFLREFLAADDCYAYGAHWTAAFLARECERVGVPGIPNRLLELDGLPGTTVAAGRKPGLVRVAAALGIDHPRPGDPAADADVAARIAAACVLGDAAQQMALPSLDAGAAMAPHTPLLLSRGWLASVPEVPGVYLLLDAGGLPLYVGKAANLRTRLASYVGRAFGLNRRLEALAVRTAAVETRPTATDLEARLLEARLIRRHRPVFNVARQVRRSSTVVRLSAADVARPIRLVREASADGAIYLGPYRSERAAREALALARQVYPEAFSRGRRQAVDRAAIHAVTRLLSGQKGPALDRLRTEMTALNAAGERAAADGRAAAIRAVQALETRPSPLIGIDLSRPVLVVQRALRDGVEMAYLIRDGDLVATGPLEAWASPVNRGEATQVAARLLASVDGVRAALTPESDPLGREEHRAIVLRWLMERPPDDRLFVLLTDAIPSR
ncbi:MAG: hypothetical protein IT305_25230 [Chloroflexi bacterium]|nr:hypothetical protein [Chloroflexota bacterium]